MQKTQVQSLGQEDCWRRRQQPTPVFLPGESHWQRGLVGYSPWGHKESDTTEQLTLDVYFMGFDRSHCSVSPIAGPYKVFSLWGFSSSGKPTAFQPGHILSFPSTLKNLLLHLPEKEQPFPVTETFSRVCILGGRGVSLYYFCACLKYSIIIKKSFNIKSYPSIPCHLPDTI